MSERDVGQPFLVRIVVEDYRGRVIGTDTVASWKQASQSITYFKGVFGRIVRRPYTGLSDD